MRLGFFLLTILLSAPAFAVTSIRVLTYNVYAKPDFTNARFTQERMNNICQRLRTGNWDVVMLQEVWTANHRSRLSKCGFPFVMDMRREGSSEKERSLGSGLLILSKFPLQNMQRKILVKPRGFGAIFKHGEAIVKKSVYLAQAVLPDGRTLWLANTHFVANYCLNTTEFDKCPSYQFIRSRQLKQSAEFINQRTGGQHVIFGGDFNSGPQPESHDHAWDEFPQLFPGFVQAPYDITASTSSATNTFKDDENGKLDHIYVSPDLQARNGAVVFTDRVLSEANQKEMNLSDHYGWETTVDIP